MKCNSKGNLISSNLSSGNCSYLESASFMIFFSCSFLILIWTYSLQTEQTSHFSVLGWFVPLGPPGKGECAKWWGIPGQSYLAIAITEKNHPNYLPNYKTTVFGIPSTGLVLLFIHVFIYSFDSLIKHKFINLYLLRVYMTGTILGSEDTNAVKLHYKISFFFFFKGVKLPLKFVNQWC